MIRSAKRLALMLSLTMAGVLVGAGQASATAYSPIPTLIGSTSPCKNVVWIGAEGSGQTYSQWNGLGDEVREGLDAYSSHMDGYTIGYYPVPYPAMAVPDADLLLLNGSIRKQYFASVDSGVKETLTFLRARYSMCPHERYVLAGYSQGAMVMHRSLQQVLTASGTDTAMGRSVTPRIDGVLAIADGDRYSNQNGSTYGTATADASGVSWAPLAKGIRYTYPPVATVGAPSSTWSSSRFHSVCDAGDLVCDFNHLSLTDGVRIHSYDYAPGGDGVVFVDSAATNISKTTKLALPRVTTRSTALPNGDLASPYQVDLNTSIESGSAPYRWTLESASAPGLSLSQNGILAGTFSTTGQATVVVTVVDSQEMSATITYNIFVVGSTSTRITVGSLTLDYPSSQWANVGQPMGNDSDAQDLTNDTPRVTLGPNDCVGCSPTVHADLQVFPYSVSESDIVSWSGGPLPETVPPITIGGVTSTWQGRFQEPGLPAGQTYLAYGFPDKNLYVTYRRGWGAGWVYPSQALTDLLASGVWSG